jgi:hypothetical protein
MKQVIELLEEALGNIAETRVAGLVSVGLQSQTEVFIQESIAILKAPRWYTPEQWEKRTGKAWPDDWAVYFRMCADKFGGFTAYTYRNALRLRDMAIAHTGITPKYQIVCATEAGPPPENWEPGK